MGQRLTIFCLFATAAGLVGWVYAHTFRVFDHATPFLASSPRPARKQTPAPDVFGSEPVIGYVWNIHDFFERLGPDEYRRRENSPSTVRVGQPLVWRAIPSTRGHIQVSGSADFSGARQHFETDSGFFDFRSAFVGENFWRASYDGKTWSPANNFRVEPRFRERQANVRPGPNRTLELDNGDQITLVESSVDADFSPRTTEVRALRPHQTLFHVGPNFNWVRVQVVNVKGELSRPTTLAIRRR